MTQIQARSYQHFMGPTGVRPFAYLSVSTDAPYPVATPGLYGFNHSAW